MQIDSNGGSGEVSEQNKQKNVYKWACPGAGQNPSRIERSIIGNFPAE